MKLMKLTQRYRKAFPKKISTVAAIDAAVAFQERVSGSDAKDLNHQSYPGKSESFLRAVGPTAQQAKSPLQLKEAAKDATSLNEITKLVVEDVETQIESSVLNVPKASAVSCKPKVVEQPTTVTDMDSSTTQVTKGPVALHDTAGMTLATATQFESANVHSIAVTDLLSEIIGIRVAIQSIAQILAESSKGKRARATNVSHIDPETLKSFEGKMLLDMPAVEALVGAKRSTIYGWIKDQRFVKPVKLSPKATRFVASEVAEWLDAQKARGSESSNPYTDL